MSNLAHALYDLRRMDGLSRTDSPVHRLHPLAKLLAALAYLVVLTSFGRHEVVRLMPLALFPIAVAAVGGVPAGPILKRLLIAEPMVICIGLFNPLFERTSVQFGPWQLGAGWLTFASIAVKGTLAVSVTLVMTAVTGMENIVAALRTLGLPRILARQLSLTYRYLTLLFEETARSLTAYGQRSAGGKRVARVVWGSLTGHILLRTVDRAERIHQAMELRDFKGSYGYGRPARFGLRDLAFVVGWCLFFLLVRLFDVPDWLGSFVTGTLS